MTWFLVDDKLHGHPKARAVSLEAMGLWILAGSYAMAYLTDGFVPDWFVVQMSRRDSRVSHLDEPKLDLGFELVQSGLWTRVEPPVGPGFLFHDWEQFQLSKESVLARRKAAKGRQQRHRESKIGPNVSRRDSRVSHAAPIPILIKEKDLSIDLSFNDFWKIYPRREAKKKAEAAFVKALREVSAEVLLAGARRYAADPNRVPEFTKLPATWLNGGCWADEALPVRKPSIQEKRDIPTPMPPKVDRTAEETRRASAVAPPTETLDALRKRLAGAQTDFSAENGFSLGGDNSVASTGLL